MHESVPGDAESIQSVFLWKEIIEAFQKHADKAGVQLFDSQPHANIVLVSEPTESYDVACSLELWGQWISGRGFVQAKLFYVEMDGGAEIDTYEIYPDNVLYVSDDNSESVSIDAEHIQDILRDVEDARWVADLSEDRAQNASQVL